ncbi:alpha-ketoglutarate-dependent sulfonate dioxygenase [Aspergillus piperis CBS 112811]|uniref:Alpha-ketoglutarate-dependent sulfonate dioxygenase n=1 Tax=Aspergillus piperis CBS 112811 TaxID=1448313 RepID=A0A8G1RCL3_9EURO|nr:alpha-ketoglutarate-dependent sulfonate dioxygenase [Aspergillus piperis CBS 112811]RAH63197.1 alpha-ketoglutarate-dependent sulfonate dioxygenase [Aspergillus piperis CBS 112811]GAA92303.1 alpha-ketoglutarate-dependent sulfonate dioxygenase [Aspergillus luchuensis IFO 4308]
MPQRIHSTGSLDAFNPILVTPVIGTEFPKDSCNIVDDILNAPNAEQRIRDLALILQMGHLTTRPATHGLHIHPVTNDSREFGDPDPEISTINSEGRKKLYKGSDYTRMAAVWHSDIAFEKAPADFSSLRLTQLPVTGGDTLWASGYEVYDRISKPYRGFLEGLSATHVGEGFKRMGVKVYEGERGAPVNVGDELEAVHPVVRTNPITGWKSVFPIGAFPSKINELNRRESANMLQYFHDLITYGHDLQVRFKWNEPNDIAIWDNRSVFHTATGDHEGFGPRSGNRAVGVGEVPYFDPESKSRREDLGIEDTLSPAHL